MNKKLLILVLGIAFVMLATPVLATETTHYNGKMAYAEIDDPGPSPYDGHWLTIIITERNGKTYMYFKIYDYIYGHDDFIVMGYELKPSELKWSYGACRVETMINGLYSLTVQWETPGPTETTHANLPSPGLHIVANGAMRTGTAFAEFYNPNEGGYLETFDGSYFAFASNLVEADIVK